MASKGNDPREFGLGLRAGADRAAEPPNRDGAHAGTEDPRTVTTGGKIGAVRISANVTDDFGNVTGLRGRY